MQLDFQSDKPIFLQIEEAVEDAVFIGAFPEETQIPSTTEISTMYGINPATVLKGMNLLVDQGILYKRRGVGMFVATGAVERIRDKRQTQFLSRFVTPMLREADKLGLTRTDIIELIEREERDEQD